MTIPSRRRGASALVLALIAGGCATARPAGFAAALPAPLAAPLAAPAAQPGGGAIFQPAGGYAPLHYGQRAHRVGDPLTVVLAERTNASSAAGSRTQRGGSLTVTPPSTGPFSFDAGALSAGAEASFNGSGDAGQSSSLSGQLSVTIAEVLPGGVVRIRGEKLLHLGDGDEWVQLSGLVRPADISADNTIASHRIADARITYGGNGSVQRTARPGWLSRFFNAVSPF